MSHGRLSIQEYGTQDLPWYLEHSLYKSNTAAVSRVFNLEFVACNRGICVFVPEPFLSTTPVARLVPDFGIEPLSINYLRVGDLNGEQVLGACYAEKRACVWTIASICDAISGLTSNADKAELATKIVLEPKINITTLDSTWGLAFHPQRPLVAASDNSRNITLAIGQPPRQIQIGNDMLGNIPSLDFLQPSTRFLDVLNHNQTVYLAFATLDPYAMTEDSGSMGVWEFDPTKIGTPEYNAKLLYKQVLPEEGWVVRGLPKHCAVPVSESPWPEFDLAKADANGYGQSYALLDIPDKDGMKLSTNDCLDLPEWLTIQQNAARKRIDQIKGSRLPKVRRTLQDTLLLASTSLQLMLCRACDFHCRSISRFSAGTEHSEPLAVAITIVEVIEPLGVVVCVARGGLTLIYRIVEYLGFLGLVHIETIEPSSLDDEVTGLVLRPETPGQEKGPWLIKMYKCAEHSLRIFRIKA